MKKANLKVGRGTDWRKVSYVLLTIDGKQIPLDPESAESLALALNKAAVDVSESRSTKVLTLSPSTAN